jgi:hypothetical protein
LKDGCGTLKPGDVLPLAQPWWQRGWKLAALSDAIKLANLKKNSLSHGEFDAINQLPANIREKIGCPKAVNVKSSQGHEQHYKNAAIRAGQGFLAGAIVGVLIGLKASQSAFDGAQTNTSRILIGAGGIGLGGALAVGIPAAYKAYEKSKLTKVETTRHFDQ